MELLTNELIRELLSIDKVPCLSLYMPTHRSHPERLQDVIRFKNLIRQMEESLLKKYSTSEVQKHMEPFEALINTDMWNHTLDGLAVFSSNGLMKVVALQESVDEVAIVADSFHTKPLRQYLQSVDRYYLLGLSLDQVRLFEGNRYSLDEVELTADSPKTITEALGDELTEKHSIVFTASGGAGGDSLSIHHGSGGKKDEVGKDAERYFRMVANFIYENYSKPTGWPLLLAALPEHHSLFQKVNENPFLLPEGITLNPASVSPDKLRNMAWEIMEPEYIRKLDSLVDKFEQARAHGKGSDDIKEVAVAAVEGRVDTLIIEADRMIAIRITNLVTGNTQKKDLDDPKVDDLLDDMGELVTKLGGQVMVLPAEKMPSETGLAAIFRY